MASIFSKIINDETPAFKVAENENFLAFLDIFPLAKGHVLVIPKKKTDYLFDINFERPKLSFLEEEMDAVAQKIGNAL